MSLSSEKKLRYEDIESLRDDIRNDNEKIVLKVMCKILPEYSNFCTCRDCLEDLFALSLNNTSPRYKQPHQIGECAEYEDMEKIVKEVEVAVKDAMHRVEKYPHHY